uniref:Uncharacterized protein n=1 Tax=Anguilla anguilla TaxID=7936 RepID=A0A0E9S4V6_ANGAN
MGRAGQFLCRSTPNILRGFKEVDKLHVLVVDELKHVFQSAIHVDSYVSFGVREHGSDS